MVIIKINLINVNILIKLIFHKSEVVILFFDIFKAIFFVR